jgi:hypothetical protein
MSLKRDKSKREKDKLREMRREIKRKKREAETERKKEGLKSKRKSINRKHFHRIYEKKTKTSRYFFAKNRTKTKMNNFWENVV